MEKDKKGYSRRDFLKTSGIATGAVIGGGLIGGLVGYNVKREGKTTAPEGGNKEGVPVQRQGGLKFFMSANEFNVISQATERIFPKDDLGPGAIELGVPFFIDNQLAGHYGSNAREYMQGPFYEGAPTQGYQSSLNRGEIFRQGIARLDEEAKKRFEKPFTELEGKQMDEILTAFQKDEVSMNGVTAEFFFKLLRMATLEGVYADPIYGGNTNMDAWRMKGFPGHHASYLQDIEKDTYLELEPKSVSEMGP
ncbi:gluconate 2-dehydrogenase subunit 3 family protein [Ornithinibacillus gellani]|uniref:gluconate 2-dehydrogenase subunit 3 family protein n=1 Tax=Ornithinibacillus gellani TaxID=2293253 RepID=UPI000F4735B1|nr:gluconate 2-dehydrogenase subunit 3 family protein [Ornithinibacillus gellani]TQS71048.1 gluconate 2-dehydrogenase subunit 3 family protein [Ornithinibacillus gellani]